MAQKDKVKELIGRSLDSYHIKTLQQIDRIKKKNKEQNHKISILTNELDNDYLTKTEEGSVVSLEHSKEGMVYLDELQGNTMVNYVTDGTKELTLNGDIDVEGTNITLTEGVDSGLVDVVCEGNTLVNHVTSYDVNNFGMLNATKLNDNYFKIQCGKDVNASNVIPAYGTHLYKPNTTYTVIVDIKENTCGKKLGLSNIHSPLSSIYNRNFPNLLGISTLTITTLSDISLDGGGNTPTKSLYFGIWEANGGDLSTHITFRYWVLEGDWTNKPIPPYFEGMKSVGECEDNKIEIKATGKNKIKLEDTTISTTNGLTISIKDNVFTINGTSKSNTRIKITNSYNVCYGEDYVTKFPIWGREIVDFVKIGKSYGTSWTCLDGQDLGVSFALKDKDGVTLERTESNSNTRIYNNVNRNVAFIQIYMPSETYTNHKVSLQIEEGTQVTSNEPYKENSMQLSLSEPLRGLPNGVEDKVMKIGDKWYVERNCGELVLDGSQDCSINGSNGRYPSILRLWVKNISNLKEGGKILCDKLPIAEGKDYPSITCTNGLDVHLPLSSDTSFEVAKQWLSENPIKVVYPLTTSYYEELPIDPTLNTYNDITHISNNSTIPCNMKIQNSGYNAIIKPSTLYTVALDTNKSGTIELNLGGAKVTTTNNVATITTPATLADDSLRLYGKGIKASKVRLLEGDKTNWIPSHFEGMKSSFEDKLQDDGIYKMEILSQNSDKTKQNKIRFSSIEPLRGVGDKKDRFVFKDDKLMIERNCGEVVLNGNENYWQGCSYSNVDNIKYLRYYTNNAIGVMANSTLLCDKFNNNLNKGTIVFMNSASGSFPNGIQFQIHPSSGCIDNDMNSWKQWLQNNPTTVAYQLKEPTYEEIPYELQKIILEGYENGTLFFDTNIPPTSTVTYAGETPIVKSVRLNKTEVLNNTNDINDNIVPYLMDMDYRVVCLQLEGGIENISMARLFGGTFEMLQRDILSKRYSKEEYMYRLNTYLSAKKITEEEYSKLGDMLNE